MGGEEAEAWSTAGILRGDEGGGGGPMGGPDWLVPPLKKKKGRPAAVTGRQGGAEGPE